jgi:hypothetical protein
MKTEAYLPPEPITAQPKCRRWPLVVAWCVAGLFLLAVIGGFVRIEQMKEETASLTVARQHIAELRANAADTRHALGRLNEWRARANRAESFAKTATLCVRDIDNAIINHSYVWPSLLPVLNGSYCQQIVPGHWTPGQWTMD